MRNERRIWAVLNPQGEVDHYTWAGCKSLSECPPGKKDSHWVALWKPGQEEADGWDAVPTSWRRVPRAIMGEGPTTVVGRTLRSEGLAFYMDDTGKARSGDQEPDEPDAEVFDEAALVPGSFRERLTGKTVSIKDGAISRS